MGLMDFFRKGKEKPVSQPTTAPQPQQNRPQAPAQSPTQAQPSQTAQPTNSPRPAAGTSQREYVIKSGDSLSKIAKQFYGNANDWQKIYQANKDKIKDPNMIHPGQKIIIP